jgi:Serine hydrolase (FSH1)
MAAGPDSRAGNEPNRRLRILCLHGFRQTASGFAGRTASLQKRLRDVAEFVFTDAPHELPFYYKRRPQSDRNAVTTPATGGATPGERHEDGCRSAAPAADDGARGSVGNARSAAPVSTAKARRAWLVSPEILAAQHDAGPTRVRALAPPLPFAQAQTGSVSLGVCSTHTRVLGLGFRVARWRCAAHDPSRGWRIA